MSNQLSLSVLDQSPIKSGGSAAEALKESVELAQLTEEMGYSRYWVAEHHGSKSFAGCSPEILIARIAAATNRIRVGSGGVMLPHYSPYKVAENFKILECLYPGRIDLGIGRAPGSDMLAAQALAYGSTIGIEYFHNKLADLKAFLSKGVPLTKGLEKIWVAPDTENVPEMWLLGSSMDSAVIAAHFGLPYCFANFITPDHSASCVDHYLSEFQPSIEWQKPQTSLGVFVLCAQTKEKIEDLAACRDLWRLRFEKGDPGPCPSIEEARSWKYTPEEKERLWSRRRFSILGTPSEVKSQLIDIAEAHQASELVIVTICHDFDDRVNSYRLIADEFNLG